MQMEAAAIAFTHARSHPPLPGRRHQRRRHPHSALRPARRIAFDLQQALVGDDADGKQVDVGQSGRYVNARRISKMQMEQGGDTITPLKEALSMGIFNMLTC